MSELPLEGLLVVALEQAVAAPIATRHLADLGARVVKIERRGEGDFARHYDDVVHGMASNFFWLNRSKESVALSIKSEGGREIVDELIARADVFVQNLAPGAAARLGLDAKTLCAKHERLIAVDLSGYGEGGPYAERRAYDLLVQSEAASVAITGWPDAHAKPGIAVADIGAGMYAYSSVLAALYQRERTGRGKAISVSLFGAITEWMGYTIYYSSHSGRIHQPTGIGHPSLAPYQGFEAADGRQVVIGIQNDREWVRLCEQVLDRPDLAADPDLATNAGRVANRERIAVACAEFIGALPHEQALARLDEADIPNARVNSVEELLTHPQLEASGRWQDVEMPAGPVPALLPEKLSEEWKPRADPVPDLGEHTASVLRELGCSDERIAELDAAGNIEIKEV